MVVVEKLVDDQKSCPVGAAKKRADLQVENGFPNIKRAFQMVKGLFKWEKDFPNGK